MNPFAPSELISCGRTSLTTLRIKRARATYKSTDLNNLHRNTLDESSLMSPTHENISVEFVDNTDINDETRRRIRSHVMRGRNVGKRRTTRCRNSASTVVRVLYTPKILDDTQGTDPPSTSCTSDERHPHGAQLARIQRPVSNELAGLPFEADLTPRSTTAMYNCNLSNLLPLRGNPYS
jgi:hypothetical protein